MSAVRRKRGPVAASAVGGAASFAIREGSLDAVRAIQARVVPRVPVVTGKLQGLFASPDAVARTQFGAQFGLITEKLRRSGFYAPLVEFGHNRGDTRIPPRPFFRPAVELAREEVRQIMADRLNEEIRAAVE